MFLGFKIQGVLNTKIPISLGMKRSKIVLFFLFYLFFFNIFYIFGFVGLLPLFGTCRTSPTRPWLHPGGQNVKKCVLQSGPPTGTRLLSSQTTCRKSTNGGSDHRRSPYDSAVQGRRVSKIVRFVVKIRGSTRIGRKILFCVFRVFYQKLPRETQIPKKTN